MSIRRPQEGNRRGNAVTASPANRRDEAEQHCVLLAILLMSLFGGNRSVQVVDVDHDLRVAESDRPRRRRSAC